MLANLSLSKLVVAYNSLAAALELASVKKFSDRATAEKRVGALVAKLEAAGKVLRHDDSGAITVAEPAPEPKPEPVADKPVAKAKGKAKKVKVAKNAAGRIANVGDDDVIQLLVEDGANPKKGTAATRFGFYKDDLTVADYIAAVGSRRQGLRDIAWDLRKKWIRVVGAKTAAKAKAEAVAKAA